MIFISLIYFLTVFLMLPLRDLSISDDFAYIQTTQHLAQTGQFRLSEWASASIIPQAYWGAMFIKLFGSSIRILHFSNIMIVYLGLIFFYSLLKRLKVSSAGSAIYTLVLFSFPWVFQYTYNFMTENFFISFLIASLYFYISFMEDKSSWSALMASLLTGMAFLNRQIAIVIPISILIVQAYLYYQKRSFTRLQLLCLLGPVSLIILGYYLYQAQVGPTTALVVYFLDPLQKQFQNLIHFQNLWPLSHFMLQKAVGYLSLSLGFLLPIFFIYRFNNHKFFQLILNPKLNLSITSVTAICFAIYWQFGRNFGIHNSLNIPELKFLSWDKIWSLSILVSLPIWVWIFGTLKNQIDFKKLKPELLLISLTLFFEFIVIVFFADTFWEEYIIQLVPLILILLAYFFRNFQISNKKAAVILTLLILFSVVITRNKYQYLGARWELSQSLVDKGINPTQILNPNWAWLPYFYFESSLTEAIRASNQDKYTVARENIKRWEATPRGEVYELTDVSADYNEADYLGKKIVAASNPYWVFGNFPIKWRKAIVLKMFKPVTDN